MPHLRHVVQLAAVAWSLRAEADPPDDVVMVAKVRRLRMAEGDIAIDFAPDLAVRRARWPDLAGGLPQHVVLDRGRGPDGA